MLKVMDKIKGIPVTLYTEVLTGRDSDGNDIYETIPVVVEDVLVGEPSTDDITSTTELYGKRLAYILGIPKDDGHDWTDKTVEFFGAKFKTFGFPVMGIDADIPGHRNKKVRVERYG